ncbi:metal-dependent hydrolase [Spirulina sp. 06S082]|uniref:metal-dependent hydrolase n=1 Tax=Spirulina sp. 06S082 TaxID=3110248 RepID=UPI002B21BFD5|nr:metal-dependent hydrolase [Spirulina sp. 06S082]MEA5469531.1 metal-dependent hydrolase [Spirulina sp. 06S082]
MSSFIGHSLAGATIFCCDRQLGGDLSTKKRDRFLWLFWLIILACTPDLDYIIPFFRPSNNQGIRITHSLAGSLILPLLTSLMLFFIIKNRATLKKYSIQAFCAGLSHLLLDILVGVTVLPLLFPWSREVFKLSFGILPSAGKISLTNYYFYRNLYLELGVILPLAIALILWIWRKKSHKFLFLLPIFLLISFHFMFVSFHLPR